MAIANIFQDNNYDLFCNSLTTDHLIVNDIDANNIQANNIQTNNINIIDDLKINGDSGNNQFLYSNGNNDLWKNIESSDIIPGSNDTFLYSNGIDSIWYPRSTKCVLFTPQGAYPDQAFIQLEPDAQDIANGPDPPPIWNPVKFQNDIIFNPSIIVKNNDSTLFYIQKAGYYRIIFSGSVIVNTDSILFSIFKNNILNINSNYGICSTSPLDSDFFNPVVTPILPHVISGGASIHRIISFNVGDFFGLYSTIQVTRHISSEKNYFVGYGSSSLSIEYLGIQNI